MSGSETMRLLRLWGLRCVAVRVFGVLLAIASVATLLGRRLTKVVLVPNKAVPAAEVSGKNWHYELNFPVSNSSTLRRLIQCESQGQNISHVDSSGQVYLGILQFDAATWVEMEQRFNFNGEPQNPPEAIHMADMMISSGLIGRWGCAHTLGLTK
jgi:Transglycosylase-like domain